MRIAPYFYFRRVKLFFYDHSNFLSSVQNEFNLLQSIIIMECLKSFDPNSQIEQFLDKSIVPGTPVIYIKAQNFLLQSKKVRTWLRPMKPIKCAKFLNNNINASNDLFKLPFHCERSVYFIHCAMTGRNHGDYYHDPQSGETRYSYTVIKKKKKKDISDEPKTLSNYIKAQNTDYGNAYKQN